MYIEWSKYFNTEQKDLSKHIKLFTVAIAEVELQVNLISF